MNEIEQFLKGGAGASVSWRDAREGDRVIGTITTLDIVDQTDPATRQVKTWADSGRPMKQLRIGLNLGDEEKMLYVSSKSMRDAISEATANAGVGLAPGGKLAVEYAGEGKRTNPAFNPPKLFKAWYQPPQKAAETAPAGSIGEEELAAHGSLSEAQKAAIARLRPTMPKTADTLAHNEPPF